MDEESGQRAFRQVALLMVDGLAVGTSEHQSPDRGRRPDTMVRAATYVGGLDLPNLQWLGLGNVHPVPGVDATDAPAALVGRLAPACDDGDRGARLRELLGPTLATLRQHDLSVHAFGDCVSELGDDEACVREPSVPPHAVGSRVARAMNEMEDGVVLAHLAMPDPAVGPVGVARAIEGLDAQLAPILETLGEHALLLIVGLGGADSILHAAGDDVPEEVAVLAYTPARETGEALASGVGLATVGATIAENFRVGGPVGATCLSGVLLN